MIRMRKSFLIVLDRSFPMHSKFQVDMKSIDSQGIALRAII